MTPNLAILDTAAAMARHAGHVHHTVAGNVARADVPGALNSEALSFAEALGRYTDGEAPTASRGAAPIVLDEQMMAMAQNAGRHDAAVSVWSKVLDMVRLAGSSPR